MKLKTTLRNKKMNNRDQYNFELASMQYSQHENFLPTVEEFDEVYEMFSPEDNYKETRVVEDDNLDALLREYNL